MSGTALRDYLYNRLNALGRRPDDGRKWTLTHVSSASNLSRSTIHGWMNGAPPSSSALRQLAQGIAELTETASAEPGLAAKVVDEILQELEQAVSVADEPPSAWEFGFVRFPPICSVPTEKFFKSGIAPQKEWSFLGTLIGLYQNAAKKTVGGFEVNVSAFADLSSDSLVGLFATSDRAAEWQFFHTPIRVPLNGVVLWRDLDAFVRLVLPSRRKYPPRMNATTCLADLRSVLWKPFSTSNPDSFLLRSDLLPLTVKNEAGSKYAQEVLGFPDEEIPRNEYDAEAEPNNLLQWLIERSNAFQSAATNAVHAAAGDLKVPVLIVDELTCLRVIEVHAKSPIKSLSDVVLLSSPVDDVAPAGVPSRPRYSVTVATPRLRDQAFDVTYAALEDLLWSNAAVVAGQCVRLFHELLNEFERNSEIRPVAALYALHWLSIELNVDDHPEQGKGRRSQFNGLRAITQAARHSSAWTDVLEATIVTLLRDEAVRTKLRAAIEHVSKDATDFAGSDHKVNSTPPDMIESERPL